MARPQLKAGSASPGVTNIVTTTAEKNSATVEVEGTHDALSRLGSAEIAAFVPVGYAFESSQLSSTGDGMGKLTVKATLYDNPAASGLTPVRTTFRIEMLEVQYDLEDHPYLAGTYRDICLKWLATDEAVRVSGEKYYYTNENGEPHEINDARALKFIAAYMAGIKTFNRYYPVVEKISVYKNPPGLTMSGNSFTGGSPTFSEGIGTYDDPPISLNGYPSGHWFKSKDSWTEGENKAWTRTEQWTFTPQWGSDEHGWIYTELDGDDDSGGGAS